MLFSQNGSIHEGGRPISQTLRQQKRNDPMGVDHKMDFFTKDFLASTLTMTAEEAGAYALSLVVGWTQGASLPLDPERIRRALRYDHDEWARLWPSLEPKWPIVGDHRENARQVEEWGKAAERSQSLSDAGRKASAMRWANRSQSPSPSPSPSPSSDTVIPSPSPLGDGFAPPTLEETRSFFESEHLTGNAEAFFYHFSEAEWRKGNGKPVRSWQLTARKWSANEGRYSTGKPSTPSITKHVVTPPPSATDADPYHIPTDEELAKWKADAEAEIAATSAARHAKDDFRERR
jgi:uncharacterized protein YdaU (DUF1376 family)